MIYLRLCHKGRYFLAKSKTRKSLDGLRGDIQELAESFAAFRDQIVTQQAGAAAERQRHHARAVGSSDHQHQEAVAVDDIGVITMSGRYEALAENGESHQSEWTLERTKVHDILAFDIDQHAQRLAAIGHVQRLGIVIMLLKKPCTANDVVTELSLGTTGAAYHHLNVLHAAGFVEQRQRGMFSLVASQTPVLLTIFAGLSGGITFEEYSIQKDMTAEAEAEDAPASRKKQHA